MQEVRDKLVTERERLFRLLQGVSFLEPYPSSANFILCKVLLCSRLHCLDTVESKPASNSSSQTVSCIPSTASMQMLNNRTNGVLRE